MKVFLIFAMIFCLGLLLSCAKNTNITEDTYAKGSNCDYKKFSGVLTIENIENKKDSYGSKFKIITGKFYADDPNAPKSLKPAEFSKEAEDREFPQITVGKRFKLQVSEKITGTCTPRLFEEPEKWIEIPK